VRPRIGDVPAATKAPAPDGWHVWVAVFSATPKGTWSVAEARRACGTNRGRSVTVLVAFRSPAALRHDPYREFLPGQVRPGQLEAFRGVRFLDVDEGGLVPRCGAP